MQVKNLTNKSSYEKSFNGFILECFVSFIILAILFIEIYYSRQIFNFVQHRTGVVLNDPLLNLLPITNVNLSYLIVPLTYIPVFVFILFNIRNRFCLMHALIAYEILLAFRLFFMYLTPLEAPIGTVPIYDIVAYGSQIITKDLFFSGHTASLVLLFFLSKDKFLKIIMGLDIIVLIGLLTLQRVHYTIDYLSAPFFSFGCYYLANHLTQFLYRQDRLERLT